MKNHDKLLTICSPNRVCPLSTFVVLYIAPKDICPPWVRSQVPLLTAEHFQPKLPDPLDRWGGETEDMTSQATILESVFTDKSRNAKRKHEEINMD